jgi:rare lipoprotein A
VLCGQGLVRIGQRICAEYRIGADFRASRVEWKGQRMTGKADGHRRGSRLSCALCCAFVLAACAPQGAGVAGDGAQATTAARGPVRSEQDVERPDIFEVTDTGLWDGRPSLGGIWVAHPDVRDPERVVIRNAVNGQSTVGALFRRERANPGPVLQLSSDAAEALGVLPGAPTELNVVVLRRQEIVVAAPVTADLPADPPAETMAETTDAAVAPVTVAALPPAAAAGLPQSPLAQVGVFSVRANADAAAATLTTAGFGASVTEIQSNGRSAWRVVAGPVPDPQALARVRALGFADAFVRTSE